METLKPPLNFEYEFGTLGKVCSVNLTAFSAWLPAQGYGAGVFDNAFQKAFDSYQKFFVIHSYGAEILYVILLQN